MVQYNKEINKPYVGFGGPRDHQRKQRQHDVGYNVDPEIVLELRQQILELKSELAKPKSNDLYTGEQVDEEIRKAIENTLKTSKSIPVDTGKLKELQSKLESLEHAFSEKEQTITQLNNELVESKNNLINAKSKFETDLANKLTESVSKKEALTKELHVLSDKNMTLSKKAIELEAKLGGLTEVLSSKDQVIESLKNQQGDVTDLRRELDKLISESSLKEARITNLTQSLKDQERISASLQSNSQNIAQNAKELEEHNKKLSIIIEKRDLQLSELNNRLSEKDRLVASKDQIIEQLTNTPSKSGDPALMAVIAAQGEQLKQLTSLVESGASSMGVITDTNRPTMGGVVIDPTTTTNLESHIEIKDVSFKQKTDMSDKVGKLKNLLGKLPSQKESDDKMAAILNEELDEEDD